VIASFADEATADVFNGANTKEARKLTKDVWSVMQRKLDMVNAAATLDDLRVPPGNRLEALKGDQRGRHSIRVNDRYRITFRFEDGNAHEVRCEDYH
jgi:proteic killer suppression protein